MTEAQTVKRYERMRDFAYENAALMLKATPDGFAIGHAGDRHYTTVVQTLDEAARWLNAYIAARNPPKEYTHERR